MNILSATVMVELIIVETILNSTMYVLSVTNLSVTPDCGNAHSSFVAICPDVECTFNPNSRSSFMIDKAPIFLGV